MDKNKPIDLTKKAEFTPMGTPVTGEKWKPSLQEETTTHTMVFGGRVPQFVDVQKLKKDNHGRRTT